MREVEMRNGHFYTKPKEKRGRGPVYGRYRRPPKKSRMRRMLQWQSLVCVVLFFMAMGIKHADSPTAAWMREMISQSLTVSTDAESIQVFLDELEEAKEKAVEVFTPVEEEGQTDSSAAAGVQEVSARDDGGSLAAPLSFREVMFYEDYDSGEIRQEQPVEQPSSGEEVLKQLKTPIHGVVTSDYGARVHPIKKTQSFHYGVDIAPASQENYTIGAAADGTVKEAGQSVAYGNYIILQHEGGIETFYGHCAQLYLQQGDVVKQGDAIALVGSTGWSTGDHVHFEVRCGDEVYNPLNYVQPEEGNA